MLYEINNPIRQTKMPPLYCLIRLLLIVCFLVITMVPFSTAGDKSTELRKKILIRYNKSVSPGFEKSPSDVGIIFSPTRISQMDVTASTMTVEGYAYASWVDVRLRWDDDVTYENITWIPANVDDVWKPNLNAFNNGRAQKFRNTEMPLFILRNGMVWWTLMGDFHFVCAQEDLRWYPLDIHSCKISLGSLYPQDMFSKIFLFHNITTLHGVETQATFSSPHWDLLTVGHSEGVISVSTGMLYSTDDFTFEVRREGWPLLATFLPLMMGFMLLSWMSFALPPRGDLLPKRLTVSTTSLFLSSVFLLVLIKTIPGVGNKPPVIVKVYASVVLLECFTCLHNVVMSNIFPRLSTHLSALRKLPKQALYILGLQDKSEASTSRKYLLENEESPQDVGLEQFQMEPGPEDSSILVGIAYDRIHIILQITVVILVVAFFCIG